MDKSHQPFLLQGGPMRYLSGIIVCAMVFGLNQLAISSHTASIVLVMVLTTVTGVLGIALWGQTQISLHLKRGNVCLQTIGKTYALLRLTRNSIFVMQAAILLEEALEDVKFASLKAERQQHLLRHRALARGYHPNFTEDLVQIAMFLLS